MAKPTVEPPLAGYTVVDLSTGIAGACCTKLLADGGEIFMPMAETFFAHRFSMFRDKFGTSWMIIHERPMPGGA